MDKEEMKARFDERVIKWVVIEREVMAEVNKGLLEGEFTDEEWNTYFTDLVEKHGGALLTQQLKAISMFTNAIKISLGINTPIGFKKKLGENNGNEATQKSE